MTNIKVGSNKEGESVRNEATLEGLVMPPITRPHPKETPLKNSIAYGRNEINSLLLAARVHMARMSKLEMAKRCSKIDSTLNGAGDRLTYFKPRSDAVCIRVEEAKPAAINMPVTEVVGDKITEMRIGKKGFILNAEFGILPTAAAERIERRESPHIPWPEVHPF